MEIFQPTTYAKITFKNHILRSATAENMADESGKPTNDLLKTYEALAKGGVGGIITGYIGISQSAKPSKGKIPTLDSDENMECFKIIVEKVHSYGTPIIAQLVHTGGQSEREDAIAPSKVRDYKAREMSEKEIREVIEEFANAIFRAKQAGFDGVELHCAHGYLLSEFFSPRTNKRRDEWGGNTHNRTRIAHCIITRARELVGDFPILAKINGFETLKGGIEIFEGIKIAKKLEEYGFDALEISNGMIKAGMATIRRNVPAEMLFALDPKLKKLPNFAKSILSKIAKLAIPTPKPFEKFNLESAKRIKEQVKIPIIAVGGIRELSEMREIIQNQDADMISLSRPLIIEPSLVKKMQEGRSQKSKCIECNYCLIGSLYQPLRCYYGKTPQS